MRAGLCTVSAPLAACPTPAAAALPPSARFLALHLLHQQTLYFVVQAKSRVRELYHQTCRHFQQQGMLDTDLFGLALICDGEYLFAEPDSKLSKYAPKSWRSSHSHGLDANGRPALAFYFRVQFYVDSPLLLRDEITRHHYYLQLRLNAASGAAGDRAASLAGLSLQADLGDRRDDDDRPAFRPEDYVPPPLRCPAALRAVAAAHRSHRGLSRLEARARFIAEAGRMQEPVNAHLFRLRASKSEPPPGSLLLAVCPRGLRVCPDNNPPSMFLWGSIGRLSFERKRFEIRTGHERLTLYTSGDEKSRLLLALCRAAHQFSMAVAPRLCAARREHEERSRWDGGSGGGQRVSVISSTSSNTTSGIVSDRVHSEDELEIMITSPPAPSTESLALAHLLDSAPASSRTSAASACAALKEDQAEEVVEGGGEEVGQEEEEEDKPTLSESSTKTSGKCAGSQCSSSCSTVVVTTAQTKPKGRRPSTTSSLELGYSHTAQNSALSDAPCAPPPDPPPSEAEYATGAAPSSHTSGVYTLTSSEQCTLSTRSDLYAASEGRYRARAASLCGSFHGDGSDPTDGGRALLSAEELSDLIVGRYPGRQSVSHTMDSDSDYVTLPPSSYQGYAPIPPKRIDSVRPPPPPYGLHFPKPPAAADEPDSRPRSPPPYPHAPAPGPPIPPKGPRAPPTAGQLLVPCAAFLPPPPPPVPRQPPPPPPTVCPAHLSRSHVEQYHRQMFSDVDFVVFPLKEPAISKQEYLEAKQGSLLAALAHQPVFYRSTPYLGRHASSRHLSDAYVQLPVCGPAPGGSPPPPPPPVRARSHDNILDSLDAAKQQPPRLRRLPPPPPPPPVAAPDRAALDIRTLREKSRKMDLPLIAALCNDRSLIRQTEAFVMPRHPGEPKQPPPQRAGGGKYPVSGLSDARLGAKGGRRQTAPVSHRHPADKLPEIPRATPNNYVMTDPRARRRAAHP